MAYNHLKKYKVGFRINFSFCEIMSLVGLGTVWVRNIEVMVLLVGKQ